MKVSQILSTFFSISILGAQAWSGGDHSGGGTAVVCRNADHTIRSAQLVDTFEPLEAYGLGLWEFKQPGAGMPRIEKTGDAVKDEALLNAEYDLILGQRFLQQTINTSLRLMLEKNMNFVRKEIKRSYKIAKEKFPGTYMYAPADLGKSRTIRIPYGCQAEFAVFYNGSESGFGDSLDVNPDVWDALNITDRVALIVHESVYQLRRLFYNDVDSTLSRDLTARLVLLAHDTSNAYSYWPLNVDLGDYRRIIPTRYYDSEMPVRFTMTDCTGYGLRVTARLYDRKGKKVGQKTMITQSNNPNLADTHIIHPRAEWTSMKIKIDHISKSCSKVRIDVLTQEGTLATSGIIEGETTKEVTMFSARLHNLNGPVTLPLSALSWE